MKFIFRFFLTQTFEKGGAFKGSQTWQLSSKVYLKHSLLSLWLLFVGVGKRATANVAASAAILSLLSIRKHTLIHLTIQSTQSPKPSDQPLLLLIAAEARSVLDYFELLLRKGKLNYYTESEQVNNLCSIAGCKCNQ